MAHSIGKTIATLRKEKGWTQIELAEKVHAITKRYNVPLIIDDRVDVALAIDAEGVHMGAEDMPIAIARKLMGENKIVGATAKTVPWAKEALCYYVLVEFFEDSGRANGGSPMLWLVPYSVSCVICFIGGLSLRLQKE